MDIIRWLDLHAGAVQAATAVIGALLTTVVARLTWRYVRLTEVLSESARQQVAIAQLNVEASTALQRSTELQLAATTMRQEEDDTRRKAALERAKRLLSGLCARFLSQFAAAPSAEPAEGFFRHTPPIDDADIAMLRDTALEVPYAEPELIEGLVLALNVMRDLQSKTRAVSPGRGYAYNEAERRMYVANLENLRRALERWTSYRPSAHV